ncbi:DoxX family protein [Flammeovirga yaeyamensis]|uniref:DoxX family protein n=1 Tax=Flammeovirga yaeyamensis TaxID=367791 RepID=A0AAX1N640_9BACT|nr:MULTISPECIES: DoxX family protein [Flammeovirga]ANQ49520.1 DoxX family protein [Flammeovirga sp. MY04]MBB3697577.1 putative membrane protein YphA (DoxX/SURF4 family) [Flammeovirga yaeyamensis]NMF36269.1 DoxX family protein [Flammeovirga yaeyamensis]QWG02998.1 DoxX family protein [Flammeovirga yaeyamensis]
MEKLKKIIVLVLKITIAIILVQTLRFKFTAHPDSVYIFTQVGMEPFGRVGIGILELVASILILIPRTSWMGIVLTLGIIGGAIMMHLTILGIEVNGDGGSLFYLAVLTEVLAFTVFVMEREKYPYINKYLMAA